MITADGERSRKRVTHAEKALDLIKRLDLPTKAGLSDGFRYRVWQMDDVSGGRIVSPFGVYVAYLGASGFKQFVCDSAECVALPVFDSVEGDRYFTVRNAAPTDYSVYTTGGVDGIPILTDTAVLVDPANQWKPPQPVCIPFGGEHIVLNATYERPSGHWVECSLATHCHNNGSTDVQAHGISGITPVGGTSGLSSHRVLPLLTTQGYLERLLWKQGVPYYATSLSGQPADYVEYQYYYAPTKVSGAGFRITGNDVFAGSSAAFRAKLAYHSTEAPLLSHSHGHFGSRTATDIKGVVAVRVYNYSTSGCTAAQIADPNHSCIDYAADSNWLLTLTFYSALSSPQVVGYNTLNPALDALATGEFQWVYASDPYVANPEMQSRVLRLLFGYGADDETTATATVPRDTATFADASGIVYSWVRCCDPDAAQRAGESSAVTKLGGFKFSHPEGFIRTPVAVPAEVLTDTSLRPRIILMTDTTYCCITDHAAGDIAGLYVGSPFGEWTAVPLPADVTMFAIRVLRPAVAGFIGVGKIPGSGTYHVFINITGIEWVTLSSIPVTDVNDLIASWDVCVFGDDPLVAQSQQVKQHPIAMQSRRPALR
jgi:hypothetical protein